MDKAVKSWEEDRVLWCVVGNAWEGGGPAKCGRAENLLLYFKYHEWYEHIFWRESMKKNNFVAKHAQQQVS